MHTKNFQDALDSFDISLEHRTDTVDIQKQRGFCFAQLGKDKDAIACFNAYLVHHTDDMEVTKWKKIAQLRIETDSSFQDKPMPNSEP